MKKFNVTGLCVHSEDYMVDTSNKLAQILEMIDKREYFTINCARQYGKTTTLSLLDKCLGGRGYLPVSISFEGVGNESFEKAPEFCKMFFKSIAKALKFTNVSKDYIDKWQSATSESFNEFSEIITDLCDNIKIVLMIDEVDKISNNDVFLNFLGTLRDKYLKRKDGKDFTFHSVILASVADIKNIKGIMIEKGLILPQEGEGVFNSPWNIAADFKVDMSFSSAEIATMLREYEADNHTGLDIAVIADEIYAYTSGYPYLVSRICKLIDEDLDRDWTTNGIQKAVKLFLNTSSTLVDDIGKNLENNSEIYEMLYGILINGNKKQYQVTDTAISVAAMYGIIKNHEGNVVVSNRIFEVLIYNHFISKDERQTQTPKITGVMTYDVIRNGHLDMALCLEKFAKHYSEIFSECDKNFFEKNGRQVFLTYLKPLINGQGFYHIESQLRDQRRMDIVVDYGKEQFILELKLWHGEQKHEEAYAQLAAYLDAKDANKGYLLTFDFRKERNRKPRAEWVEYHEKQIFDVMV